MNKFKKYYPNVFIAECEEEYNKGDLIEVSTKYGKEVQCEVFTLIANKNEKYYYSIVRVESENYAQRKANKYIQYSDNAEQRSYKAWQASKEGSDFLALAEPIKVGHHSENRHRALIERNDNRMRKCITESEKAEDYKQKAEYWDKKSQEINLSMPESLEYYSFKLDEALKHHKGLKDGSIEKEHSYSVQYANKAVKDLSEKSKIAKILWEVN